MNLSKLITLWKIQANSEFEEYKFNSSKYLPLEFVSTKDEKKPL